MKKDITGTKKKILKALKGKQEIVINRCWGGFGLSIKAVKRYAELKGFKVYPYFQTKYSFKEKEDEYTRIDDVSEIKKGIGVIHYSKKDLGKKTNKLDNNSYFSAYDIKRDDEALVQVVKELGKEANEEHSELKIVKIPSYVEWGIDDYDGMETIEEVHQEWS